MSLTLVAFVSLIIFLLPRRKIEALPLGQGKRTPTEYDEEKAMEYAMSKICATQGYGSDSQRCTHTLTTCKRDHGSKNQLPEYGEWLDNKCISVDTSYRDWCKGEGLTPVQDSSGVYKCVPNERYCKSNLVDWRNGDCYRSPTQYASEAIFGTTITRGAKYATEKVHGFRDDVISSGFGAVKDSTKKIFGLF